MSSRNKRKSEVSFFDSADQQGSNVKKSRSTPEGPLPWIHYNEETAQYEVDATAHAFLESLQGPLSVCSVVGNYRTGKSFLLNKLVGGGSSRGSSGGSSGGSNDNFMVSGTTASCTKGLWVMRRTLRTDNGTNVLIVDTEGLGSMSATETHDLRVFSLALLLSSTFLYNSTGAITEATLNNLSLVANLTEHVRVTASEQTTDAAALAECFPHFVYVARDFSLQLVGDDGEEVDSTTYLNQSLKVRGEPDSSKNRVRTAINKLFPTRKRSCVCMVRPCANESDLQNLQNLSDQQLRPEFLATVAKIRRTISETPAASHGGMVVTGPLLARLACLYVDAINGGAIPAIRDSWTLLSEGECRASADAARQVFQLARLAQAQEVSVVAARKGLRDGLEQALRVYDEKAVGPAANQLRVALAADMETQVRMMLAEVQNRAQQAMREKLSKVESRISREASTIKDVIDAYIAHKDDMVEKCGEESLAVWWPEAFPSLCRSVEAFSFRAEKKRHALQVRVDAAELEIAKAKAEAAEEVSRLTRELENATRGGVALEERANAAERRVENMQRQHDMTAAEAQVERAQSNEKIANLRAQLDEIAESSSAAPATAEISEEQSQRVLELSQKLALARSTTSELEDQLVDAERRAGDFAEQARDMEKIVQEAVSLRGELENAASRAAEAEATERALRSEIASVQSRHADESATVQKEAMETVDAIKTVLTRERERHQASKKKHDATLQGARESAAEHAASLEKKIRQLETSASERESHFREAKRLADQERESLRSEIDRYTTMFREQREGQETNRRGWLQQIQDMRTSASTLSADHKEATKEQLAVRRELEADLATIRANAETSERRRKTLEEELGRSRQMLSQSKNSGVEMARMTAELSGLRDAKDRFELEARSSRTALAAAKKAEQDARRNADLEMTRIRMRYERQISVLESRLLE